MLYRHKDCYHSYRFGNSIHIIIMFALLFTVFVTLSSNTGPISEALALTKVTLS